MAHAEKSIDVAVPVRTVYNQWTQFESFPQFMGGVEEVRQVDDTHLYWRAKIAGKEEEWTAEITEQIPDQRVAWRSTTGAENAGVVTFAPVNATTTHVTLSLDYAPQGAVETAGAAMGVLDRQVEGDLERFKTFIEARGSETGAWRGEVRGGDVTGSAT